MKMITSKIFKSLLFIFLFFAVLCFPLFAQNYTVKINPSIVKLGQNIVVSIELSGIIPEHVEAIKPNIIGNCSFVTSNIRTESRKDGFKVTVLDYILKPHSEGEVKIEQLSVRVRGRILIIGSYTIDVEPGQIIQKQFGKWICPESVYQYECFIISLEDENRNKIAIPPVSISGLRLEAIDEYTMLAISVSPDQIIFPKQKILETEIPSKKVSVKTLPKSAEICRAIGKNWNVEIEVPAFTHEDKYVIGDIVPVNVFASGYAWPNLANPPNFSVNSPSGKKESIEVGTYNNFKKATDSDSLKPCFLSTVGQKGTFLCKESGTYTIETSPYYWFDIESEKILSVGKKSIQVFVDNGLFSNNQENEKEIAHYAKLLGERKKAFALESNEELIAKYCSLFGNCEPEKFVLIPYGFFAIAFILSIFLMFILIFIKLICKQKKKFSRMTVFFLIIAVICCGFTLASYLERNVKEFVFLGGETRKVPSLVAEVSMKNPGKTGKIVKKTNDWTLVEFYDGKICWIKTNSYIEF